MKERDLLAKDTAILISIIEGYKKDSLLQAKKEIVYKDVIKNYQKSLINAENSFFSKEKELKQKKLENKVLTVFVLALSAIMIFK